MEEGENGRARVYPFICVQECMVVHWATNVDPVLSSPTARPSMTDIRLPEWFDGCHCWMGWNKTTGTGDPGSRRPGDGDPGTIKGGRTSGTMCSMIWWTT